MNRNDDFSEKLCYNVGDLPLLVSHEHLSELPTYRELVHWHPDFEFIMVTEGILDFSVNDKTLHLKRGQSLFVNSNRLHFGYSDEKKEVLFDLAVISPQLIETPFNRNEIEALSSSENADFLLFDKGSEIWELLQSVIDMGVNKVDIFTLQSYLCRLIYKLNSACDSDGHGESESARMLRKMLTYIKLHYDEKINVADIAKSAAVGRSLCFSIFREYMNVTPQQYLTQYRLSKGAEFLLRGCSVLESAQLCGFTTQSHFTKVFREIYGMTPKEYKKHERFI